MFTPLSIDRDTCRDYLKSSRLEWLETNGTGAFAMGSVAGSNTRRYHAHLLASMKPPVERFVLLSRIEETVEANGQSVPLSCCQYPGTVSPTGNQNLTGFSLDPMPAWTWNANGITVRKELFLVEGRQAVVIRYSADAAVTLFARPFLAFRDYHSMSHANDTFNRWVDIGDTTIRMKPYQSLPALEIRHSGAFHGDGNWYHDVEYLGELDRGLDFREDVYTPGSFEIHIPAGGAAFIVAAVDSTAGIAAAALYALRTTRTFKSRLEAAADIFRATRADGEPTILAGFPWFTDWGRDTMISLPGLLISRGMLDEARRMMNGFLAHMNQGIIPNRFPDAGETPEYNTVDGTLWMFPAVKRYLDAGGDRAFLKEFYPRGKEIIDWHRMGTWYGIGVDPSDSLLRAGGPGTQLTWMDAKIGDWVVTPRHGKPVEINALWYNALCLMSDWASALGDRDYSKDLAQQAERVRASFRAKFWNPSRQCLYDVLHDEGPVGKLRPNQLFAVSLPYPLLDPEEQRSVVRAVERELLTPVGLRTLDRNDPEYRPRYRGNSWERDSGYHQGTVWPWLIGPFIDAYLTAFGKTQENLDYCAGLAARMEQELTTCGLGSIAEVYDADAPHAPGGCPAQAWSVAELLRVCVDYGFDSSSAKVAAAG
jgi:predicted glycogen debranching enzyme